MTEMHKSWQRLWRLLGARTEGMLLHDELLRRHSEPHRKYHTLQHLSECIAWFEFISAQAQHPAELEAALWFHDSIYELDRNDNEECSAKLARDTLSEAGVPAESVARIERLVLATRHTEPPASLDEQFMVDIDLSIFGATESRFAEYEQQIRDEYALVPSAEFQKKRRVILCSFLGRRHIYQSEVFRAALEERARANLQRATRSQG